MELQTFVTQLVEKSGGEILGRVRLQKLVYFCKALGAEFGDYGNHIFHRQAAKSFIWMS